MEDKLWAGFNEKKEKCGYCMEFMVNVKCPVHGKNIESLIMENDEYFKKYGKTYPHKFDPVKKPSWLWRHTHDHCGKCYTKLKLIESSWCTWDATCSKCGTVWEYTKGLQY